MQGQLIKRKIEQALKNALPKGSTALAAVSGGADSMALAGGLYALQKQAYCSVFVVHVEHGLRGQEAMRDAALVETFCQERKLPFICRHVDVLKHSKKNGLSVENAARSLRYQALQEEADFFGAQYILTAHHSDDQAETVLLKLLRGAGAAGLSGMELQHGRIIRPFLQLSREELIQYCQESNLAYCHDSSNDDVYYTRNKIRLQLLPYLQANFNPSVKKALLQTAAVLQEDEQFFEALVEQEWGKRITAAAEGLTADTQKWEALAPSVRRRLLRRVYFAAGGTELSYRHTEALDKLCLHKRSGAVLKLPQHLQAYYAYERLLIGPQAVQTAKTLMQQPLNIFLRDGFTADCALGKIEVHLTNIQPVLRNNRIIYPLDLLDAESLVLRSRQDGDRFYPYGGTGSKKLKDYFIDRKLPRHLRDSKLLACCGNKILGIFGVANAAWPQGSYKNWLQLELMTKENDDE